MEYVFRSESCLEICDSSNPVPKIQNVQLVKTFPIQLENILPNGQYYGAVFLHALG